MGPALLAAGCTPVESVSELGVEGRVWYRIYAQGWPDDATFDDVRLITGHEHQVHTNLSDGGEDFVWRPKLVEHLGTDGSMYVETTGEGAVAFSRSEGRCVELIPGFTMLATEPGEHTVQTVEGDKLVDQLPFTFARPASLDMQIWMTPPVDPAEWRQVWPPLHVEVGSEIAIFLTPLDENDERMLGEVVPVLRTEPPNVTAPVWGVHAEAEEGARSTLYGDLDAFTVLSPGAITVYVQDERNGLTRTFVIEAIPRRPRVEVSGRGSVDDLRVGVTAAQGL